MASRLDKDFDSKPQQDEGIQLGRNRRERRRIGINLGERELATLEGRVNLAFTDLLRMERDYHEKVEEYGADLTLISYKGPPTIGRLVEAKRKVPELFESKKGGIVARINRDNIEWIDKVDIFSWRINGLNLFDIERMPLPLGIEDISQINRLFSLPRFRFPRAGYSMDWAVRENLFVLSVQPLARSDEAMIPASVQPLYSRVHDYFDYYTRLMTDFSLGFEEERNLVFILLKKKPWLPQILGAYIPARLGITPHSAINLFRERAQHTGLWTFNWEIGGDRSLVGVLIKGAKHAAKNKALPPDLFQRQYHNPQNDQDATAVITSGYRDSILQDSVWIEANEEAQGYLDRLFGSRKSLQNDIASTKDKRIVIRFPEGHVVQRATVVSQYRQTLTFMLDLKGGSHLTIEYAQNSPVGIDRDDHVYGFPADLLKRNTGIPTLLVRDVLGQLFALYPAMGEPVATVRLNEVVSVERSLSAVEQTPYVPKQKEEKSGRLLRVLTPIQQVLAMEPSLPPISEHSEKQFIVTTSRSQIEEVLPRNIPAEVVDRLMARIHDFEFGRKGFDKKLEVAGDSWELREGDYRIIVEPKGGRYWSVIAAGHRQSIFKGRRFS